MADQEEEQENQKEQKTVKVELEVPADKISIEGKKVSQGEEESSQDEEESSEKKPPEPKSLVEKATGYKAGELIDAPLKPPEASARKRPVRGQLRSIIIGFSLVILSLIAWPIFGFRVAIAVVLVGATFIAVGTLVRI